jgi:hypothetical protein
MLLLTIMSEKPYCQSYKSLKNKTERCPYHALPNSKFCGHHQKFHVETHVEAQIETPVVSLCELPDYEILMLCQGMLDRKEYQSLFHFSLTCQHMHNLCRPLLIKGKRQLRPCIETTKGPLISGKKFSEIWYPQIEALGPPIPYWKDCLKVHPTPQEFEQLLIQYPNYKMTAGKLQCSSNVDELLEYGNYDLLKYIIHQYGSYLLNMKGRNFMTPLMRYVCFCNYEIVKMLLELGADVNRMARHVKLGGIIVTTTALNCAIERADHLINKEIVRLLIKNDAILGLTPVSEEKQQLLESLGYKNP